MQDIFFLLFNLPKHIKAWHSIPSLYTGWYNAGKLSTTVHSQTNSQMRNAATAARMSSATRTPTVMPTFPFDVFSLLVKKSIRSWLSLRPWCRKKHINNKQSKCVILVYFFYLLWLLRGVYPKLKMDPQIILQGLVHQQQFNWFCAKFLILIPCK